MTKKFKIHAIFTISLRENKVCILDLLMFYLNMGFKGVLLYVAVNVDYKWIGKLRKINFYVLFKTFVLKIDIGIHFISFTACGCLNLEIFI